MAGSERVMLTVFCYDIGNDRVRRRVAAILEEAAVRVQESVFEARLTEPQATRLADAIRPRLGPDDSLRVYAVSAAGRDRSFALGPGPMAEAQNFYLL